MADARWSPGAFVWRELVTDDLEQARRFYGELFGWSWKVEDLGRAGAYGFASRGAQRVGGVVEKPRGVATPSAWSSYVLVDAVDAAARRCTDAGGRVLGPPEVLPGIGRFAAVQDPWGAVLLPLRPSAEREPPGPGPGTFCWETLVTPDPEAAAVFYRKVVGFGTAPAPSGEGKVLTSGQTPVADLQAARPGGPSYWATYVAVAGLEAARDRAVALGGKAVVPRVDVPNGGVAAIVADPSGATLGLLQAAAPA